MIIVKKKKGEYWTEHRKFKKTKQRKKKQKNIEGILDR